MYTVCSLFAICSFSHTGAHIPLAYVSICCIFGVLQLMGAHYVERLFQADIGVAWPLQRHSEHRRNRVCADGLLPTVLTVLTGGAGLFGGQPLMWVIMASALTFAGSMVGLLGGSLYLERKNPHNKLKYKGTHFQHDLDPAPMPALGNRHQRRGQAARGQQMLQPAELVIGVPRTLEKGQIAVELKNEATFPISFILASAETEVEGITPPRAHYPKDAITIFPGNTVQTSDAAIILNSLPCGRLTGKMEFKIRYGQPGEEKFEMLLKANLDIHMETFGFVSSVRSAWTV